MPDDFLTHRPLLFGIAYRMLGSVAEAEDAVQDAYLRWQKETAASAPIRSAKAWLVAATTRLCIDRLRSARRQREEYFGVWLPEPLCPTTPAHTTTSLAESLSTAFLLLLETLTPDERAVFLLHEAFDYRHTEIAEITGKSAPASRQLLRRAKARLSQRADRPAADPADAEALVQRFLAAARTGTVTDLLATLTSDASLRTDGGGRVRASPLPIRGAAAIARFLLGIRVHLPASAEYRPMPVNGGLGVVVLSGRQPVAVITFAFDGDRIREVYSVSNPDKLRHVAF